jgi:hypothetical protein
MTVQGREKEARQKLQSAMTLSAETEKKAEDLAVKDRYSANVQHYLEEKAKVAEDKLRAAEIRALEMGSAAERDAGLGACVQLKIEGARLDPGHHAAMDISMSSAEPNRPKLIVGPAEAARPVHKPGPRKSVPEMVDIKPRLRDLEKVGLGV